MKQWQKIVGILFMAGVIFWAWKASQPTTSKSEQQKPVGQILETDWVLGNREAKVQVIEYSDLQCPACKFYNGVGQEIVSRLGDNVGFAYRHFPLKQIHKNAVIAAQAAEAAGKQGKFWEMEKILFDNQAEWEGSNQAFVLFSGYGKEIGLDADMFRQDIDSAEVKDLVEADYLSALVSKIDATPTFFINGQKINNLRGIEDLITRVRFALEEATASAKIIKEQ